MGKRKDKRTSNEKGTQDRNEVYQKAARTTRRGAKRRMIQNKDHRKQQQKETANVKATILAGKLRNDGKTTILLIYHQIKILPCKQTIHFQSLTLKL